MFERRTPASTSEPSSEAHWYTCDAAVPSFRFALTQDYNHPPPRALGAYGIYGQGVDDTNPADVWSDAARKLYVSGGSCAEHPGNAIPDGAQAYRIRSSAFTEQVELDFDLCAACYMGIARPLGFQNCFVQTIARNKICDLGHARPEREELMRVLISACAVRDFKVFERWLQEKAHAKQVAGAELAANPGLLVPRIEDFRTNIEN